MSLESYNTCELRQDREHDWQEQKSPDKNIDLILRCPACGREVWFVDPTFINRHREPRIYGYKATDKTSHGKSLERQERRNMQSP